MVVVFKIDPVEEVGAIPGVGDHGFRPAEACEVAGDPFGGLYRCLVFFIGGRDSMGNQRRLRMSGSAVARSFLALILIL
jgi:hypothetical protein